MEKTVSPKQGVIEGSMMYQLSECVQKVAEWEQSQVLVLMGPDPSPVTDIPLDAGRLAGANGDFCSGGDLGFMEAIATPKLGCRMSIFMQEITSTIYRLPVLSVAFIQGNPVPSPHLSSLLSS